MANKDTNLVYGWSAQSNGAVSGQTGYAQEAYTGSSVLLSELNDVILDEAGN